MASTGRGGRPAAGPPVLPETMAQVVPASTPMIDHSFTLQAVMELQKSLSELSAKTDRLIKDVESQNGKLDAVRQQISFARGALLVIAFIGTTAITVATVYLRTVPAPAPTVMQAPASRP